LRLRFLIGRTLRPAGRLYWRVEIATPPR